MTGVLWAMEAWARAGGGQNYGGSSSGGNTSGCVALTAGRQITEALAGTPGVGTGDLK